MRPRDPELDAAIEGAAAELVVELGYRGVTVEAIARRAGTTRPALYRRHRTLADLVVTVLTRRYGTDPVPDTGTLRGDLLALQRHQVRFFTDPVVARALPGLLDEMVRSPDLAEALHERFLAPRRASTRAALHRAAARGEIPAPADPDWTCDLVTGPLIMRVLLPGVGAIDEHLAQLTVDAALADLRR